MKTNSELRKDVMEEISYTPELWSIAPEIGVAAKDGVVTLTGTVDSYWKKLTAEEAAQKVVGVKVVASDLEVKVQGVGKKTDTDIVEAVKNALRWNSSVDDDQIEVKVDNGWVYLTGKVDWPFQRDSARRSVENLVGVIGVSNNITLKPSPIDTKDIKSRISAAFHRSATIDSGAIRLETSDGTVTLRGTVRSWSEKKEAENIAWASPGVVKVQNQIEVDPMVFA